MGKGHAPWNHAFCLGRMVQIMLRRSLPGWAEPLEPWILLRRHGDHCDREVSCGVGRAPGKSIVLGRHWSHTAFGRSLLGKAAPLERWILLAKQKENCVREVSSGLGRAHRTMNFAWNTLRKLCSGNLFLDQPAAARPGRPLTVIARWLAIDGHGWQAGWMMN